MGSTVACECLSEHMTAPNPLSYQLVTDSWRLVAEVLGLGQVDLDKEELTTAPTTIIQSTGKANNRSPATAPSHPPPEWRTTGGIYGEHRHCGTCHRRDQPCPRFAWEERAAGVGTG
jgi:hypothetical protein